MASAYSEVGPKLVERGYAALPVAPGTKVPGQLVGGTWTGMNGWSQRYVERLPTEIEVDHWSNWPDAGVCVVTGAASRDLVGIDIDVDDAPIVAAIKAVLPPTPVRKAGSKGETLFYRSASVGSRSFSEYRPNGTPGRRLCDVIGPGRQTVLPPTVHSDTGLPYRWLGEDALENVDPDDLPELPDDVLERLAEALRPFGYQSRPETPARGIVDADSPFRAINETALANLDAWVTRLGLYGVRPARGGYEAVPAWRASATGRPLEKRKRNLKVHPDGIRDMGADEGFTPLDLVMTANGCDFDTALAQMMGWLGMAGFEIELQPKATHKRLDDGSLVDMETGEITMPPEPLPAQPAPSGFVEHILASNNLVGEIARWVHASARRPQPKLAVATGLALVATVASRQMVTPTFSNLNLYLLMTARSGNGKDAPMKAVKAALSAAKLSEMIGPEGAASDVGLMDHANLYPASIMPIDEFGDFIGAISGQRAPTHTLKIMATMRQLWDGGLMRTSHALTRRSVTLHNPCLSMLCASTPGQFYDVIGSAQILNGFINRFVLFHAGDDAPRGADDRDITDVPPDIARALAWIADRPGGMNAMRFRTGPAEAELSDKPYVVKWASPAARDAWIAYEDHNLARMKGSDRLEAFAPRCAQNAVKIATILAIGQDPERPAVSEEHVRIGIEVVESSLADVMGGYSAHVPESRTAALGDKVVERIRREGGTATKRDVFRSFQRAFTCVKEMDDLMKMLAEAGRIVITDRVPESGGTRIYTYHLI